MYGHGLQQPTRRPKQAVRITSSAGEFVGDDLCGGCERSLCVVKAKLRRDVRCMCCGVSAVWPIKGCYL